MNPFKPSRLIRHLRWLPWIIWLLAFLIWPSIYGFAFGLLGTIVSAMLLPRRVFETENISDNGALLLRSEKIKIPLLPLTDRPRTISHGEIGMGGPAYENWLLPDGAALYSIFDGVYPLADARWFIGYTDYANSVSKSWVIYDSQEHVIHYFPAGRPDEQGLYILDHLRRCTDSTSITQLLAAHMQQASSLPLVQLRGLWLPAESYSQAELNEIQLTLPNGVALSGKCILPNDFRTLEDPHYF